MKTEKEPVKHWYNYWPFLVASIVLILNVDYGVIPTLQSRYLYFFGLWLCDLSFIIPKLSLVEVFIIVSFFSIAGTLFWYWLLGWLGRSIVQAAYRQKIIQEGQKIVQEGVELGKKVDSEIIPVLNREGYLDRLKNYVVRTIKWATADDNKFLKRIKKFGYFAIFGLAASPEFGSRFVATIISRSYGRSRSLGLACLLLGETFKNFYMVFGFWNLVLRLPGFYFQTVIIAVVVYFVGRFVYKKIIKRPI